MKKTAVLLLVILLLSLPFSALAEYTNDSFFLHFGDLCLKGPEGKEYFGFVNLSTMTRTERIQRFGTDFSEFFAYYGVSPVSETVIPELGDNSLSTGLLAGAAVLTLTGAIIARKKQRSLAA